MKFKKIMNYLTRDARADGKLTIHFIWPITDIKNEIQMSAILFSNMGRN